MEKNNIFSKDLDLSFLKIKKVKVKEIIIFYNQLSVMLAAGVGISDCFDILIEETKENKYFKNVLTKIFEDIKNGVALSISMSKNKQIFNEYEINIVKSGEATGKLDESLKYLAEEIESNNDIFNKVKSALAYPAFVVATMICVFILMMLFVVPKIVEMVKEMSGNLPLPTKLFIGFAEFFQKNIPFILIGMAILVVAVLKLRKTEKGRYFFDSMKIKLPVLKDVYSKIYIVRFTRSFYTLLKAGISINEALIICSEIVGNVLYKEAIRDVSLEIANGKSISSSFEKYENLFPTIFIKMVSIGERTGELDELVNKTNSFFYKDLQNITGSITSLIEPVIIIVLGIAVAIIAIAILLPMYSLSSQF